MLKVCPVHHQFPYMGGIYPQQFSRIRQAQGAFIKKYATLYVCVTHPSDMYHAL